jgi:hypothetical protein
MAHMNLGGSAVAAIVLPHGNYVGIDGVVVEGQATIVSSAQSYQSTASLVLSGESVVASSFTPRYYSPRPATSTVTITDYAELNTGDKVTLRSASDPSTDIDFAVDLDGPATSTVTITDYAELNTGDKVTLRSASAPSTDIDFAVDPDIAAVATITITDYAELNAGDKVTLRATNAPGVDIDFDIPWGAHAPTYIASALATLIDANSNFSASVNNTVVTITQSIEGAAGNTTVVLTDSGNAGMSKTDFTGGVDGDWDVGSSNASAADALAIFIDANSNFSASANNAVVTITQSVGSVAGNTTVSLTDSGDAGMSKTDFAGGSDGSWDLGVSNNEAASALAIFINANANFSAAANNAVVTITQSAKGTAGNTTVSLTDSGDAGMSKTDFSGGVDNPIEGGMVLGGVCGVISTAYSFSGSGGIQSSGSLDEHWTVNPYFSLRPIPSGGISLAGLGGAYISNYVGLVSLELGGTSLPFKSNAYSYAGTGGPVMSGLVHASSPSWTYPATGGISLGGGYYPRFNVIGNDVTTSVESASTFVSDATVGTVDWTSPSSSSSNDDQYASVVLSSGVISKYLKSTNFGFSIPSVDTIIGVRVLVDKHQTGGESIKDESIRLVKDGVIQGDDKILPPSGDWMFSPPPWGVITSIDNSILYHTNDGSVKLLANGSYVFNSTSTTMSVANTAAYDSQSFMRFADINVPNGAKITSAKITLYVKGNTNANGQTATICANASDDAIVPYTAHAVTGAIPTTSNVTWTFDNTQSGNFIETPDISSVIQEIVDRDGWTNPDSAMVVYFRDPSSAGSDWEIQFSAFGFGSLNPMASLEITYYDPAVVEYGFNYDDTWGLDLTYDDINDSTFGVVHSAKNDLPSSAAGSGSALIDYVKMSIYHLKVGATIGGSANVGVPFVNYVGSGGITISGEGTSGSGGSVVSSSYVYVGSGVVTLSGTSEVEGGGASSSGYFEDLTTSVKYDVTYSGFDVFFEQVEAPAHVVDLPDVVNLCGCDPINPIVNLKHNLLRGESKLGMFLRRNSFTLPVDIKLIYNSITDSWRHNFHYISIDGIEHFDILFEWSCVSVIGSNELGYDAWKFSVLIHYKDTKVDKDTRVILVFPKGHFCSRGQRLDASFEINTQSKITMVTSSSSLSGSFVVDTIINDDIGLFVGNYWNEHPDLDVDIEEEVETSTTFIDLDARQILPKEDFQTGIISEEAPAYGRIVTAPASAFIDTYKD